VDAACCRWNGGASKEFLTSPFSFPLFSLSKVDLSYSQRRAFDLFVLSLQQTLFLLRPSSSSAPPLVVVVAVVSFFVHCCRSLHRSPRLQLSCLRSFRSFPSSFSLSLFSFVGLCWKSMSFAHSFPHHSLATHDSCGRPSECEKLAAACKGSKESRKRCEGEEK
jgi:hypothetical protein